MENFLKNVPFFSRLRGADLAALSSLVKRKTFEKEESIIYKDEPGNALYMIVEGKVKVVITSEEGQEMEVATLREGEFFGEMSLFGDFARSADVISMEKTQLAYIEKRDFIDYLKKNPEIAIGLLREMANRLKVADEKIESLGLMDVQERISRTLVNLAKRHGAQISEGILITEKLTHQHLADMCGVTRETVTRNLKKLSEKGRISFRGRQIILSKDLFQPFN